MANLIHTFRLSTETTVQSVIPALASKLCVSENAQLKAAIEQQNADIEELRDRALSPRRVKRYQRMQTQLEQTKRALDELSGQYERQSTEMAEALGTRTILSSSIARLLAIIQEQELLQNQVTNSDDVIQIMSEIEVAGIGKICRTKGFSTPEK